MSKLEKFKRRLVRIVTRLQRQEKKPEDELWAYLKKETNCDCKWLWERMRTLTLKRLKRLLIAEDKQENMIAIARMSITDWLLYDLILVHEDIDVTGMELMGERKVEPRPLFELFSLIQRFELEGLSGSQLACAWLAAIKYYNEKGRQCSPMLLQRRWYEMKLTARNQFYKFWFTYRGNNKYLQVALNSSPTRLQMAIAKRYPHIITKKLLKWDEMVEKRMVILREEFEVEMKRAQNLPKPSVNLPDVVLLEPEIETIDLGVDSDSENELKEHVETEESVRMEEETENAVANIAIVPKIEPKDDVCDVSTNPIQIMDIDDELIELDGCDDFLDVEENNKVVIQPLDDVEPAPVEDAETSVNQSDVKANEQLSESKEPHIIDVDEHSDDDQHLQRDKHSVEVEGQHSIDHDEQHSIDVDGQHLEVEGQHSIDHDEQHLIDVDGQDLEVEGEHSIDNDGQHSIDVDGQHSIDVDGQHLEVEGQHSIDVDGQHLEVEGQHSIDVDGQNSEIDGQHMEVDKQQHLAEDNVTTDIMDDTNNDEPIVIEDNIKVEATENNIECEDKEQPLIPQITNVFGNVHIEVETLAKITNFLDKATPQDIQRLAEPVKPKDIESQVHYSEEEEEEDIIKTHFEQHYKLESIEELKANIENAQNVVVKEEKVDDLTFDDEGIEFEDDGIVIEDDSSEREVKTESEITCERVDIKIEEEESETNKFDLKLLMEPVVYTTRLDDMRIFKHRTFETINVDEKVDISDIIIESKPVSIKSVSNVKKEEQKEEEKPCSDVDDNNDDDDLFHNESDDSDVEYIPDTKRVKLTSSLLQKPRYRVYNPIILCKNPDFNTRLKRLTVGFLSSTRNRRLLKACFPLTIDVSKTFETKLVDNTLYLKTCQNIENVTVNNTFDKFIENKHTTVIPSAMPAQSLIDISKSNAEELINRSPSQGIINERNKVINLPNIDNVRRINQTLLVAEVSPIQVRPVHLQTPPVQIVPQEEIRLESDKFKPPNNVDPTENKEKDADKSNRTVICSGTVIRGCNQFDRGFDTRSTTVTNDSTKQNSIQRLFDKYKLSAAKAQQPKRILPTKVQVGWSTARLCQNLQNFTDETLLTLDTLNKMLHIIDESRDNKEIDVPHRLSKNRELIKRQMDLERKLYEYEVRISGNSNEEIVKPAVIKTYSSAEKKARYRRSRANSNRKLNNAYEDTIESVVKQSHVMASEDKETAPKTKIRIRYMDAHPKHSQSEKLTSIDDTDNSNSNIIEIPSSMENTDNIIEIPSSMENTDNIIEIPSSMENTDNIIEIPSSMENTDNIIEIDATSEPKTSNPVSDNLETAANEIVSTEKKSEIVEIDDSPEEISDSSVKNSVTNKNSLVDILERKKRGRPRSNVYRPRERPYTRKESSYKLPPPQIRPYAKIAMKPPKPGNNMFCGGQRMRQNEKLSHNDTEKVLFLSSKNISKKSNGPPIYLGKNKILLTDVKFPSADIKNATPEPYPCPINIDLPKGVQMVMSPNGEITCNIDPHANLTLEQLTVLPSILASLKQSGAIPDTPQLTEYNTKTNDEIVNISDDETNPTEADSTKVYNTQQNVVAETTGCEPIEITNECMNDDDVLMTSETETCGEEVNKTNMQEPSIETSSVVHFENDAIEDIPVNIILNKSCEGEKSSKEINKNIQESNNNTATTNLGGDNIEIPTKDSDQVQSSDAVENDTVKADVETDKTSENSTAIVQRKTILSDLMEMSGISEEDIMPVPEALQTEETLPSENELTVHLNNESITHRLVVDGDLNITKNKINTPNIVITSRPEIPIVTADSTPVVPVLNPITSFAELKYAFENNGNFFKLDVITKTLVPINVCIKKHSKINSNESYKSEAQKVVIDLTDETGVIEEQEETTQDISTQTPEKVTKEPVLTPKKPITVKPLKMFKVVRPNILKRTYIKRSSGRSLLKGNAYTAVSRTVNLVKAKYDADHIKRLRKDLGLTPVITDSESSDDEPLAVIAQRKADAQEVQDTDAPQPVNENEKQDLVNENTEEILDLPIDQTEGQNVENSEMEMALGPSEVSLMSDQEDENDEGDDDMCILGV